MHKLSLAAVVLVCVIQVVLSKILQHRHKDAYSTLLQPLRRHDKFHIDRRAALNDPPEFYFDQQALDHFTAGEPVTFWSQRYFVNTTFYKPGGPIFLLIGGEGPLTAAAVTDRFVLGQVYAPQFNALIVALEHRFYGKSIPRPEKGLSTENLYYLTSEQALADLANFIPFVKQKYTPDNLNAKVVVFGGSYPGNLAAWFRLKYPHLAVGALASSAPVRAKLEFHEYMEVVADSLGDSCTSKVRQATDKIETMLQTPAGRATLQSQLKLCSPLNSDLDMTVFVSSLSDQICEIVQYNLDNRSGAKFNISRLCTLMDSMADPYDAYVQFITTYQQEVEGGSCLDANWDDYLQSMKNEQSWPSNPAAAGRSWYWQTCNEFGYYQNAVGDHQPFSNRITLEWMVQQCEQIYGIPKLQPNIDWTNTVYGSDQIQVNNVVFVDGTIDPWHVLSVTKNVNPSTPFKLVTGTAHCADLYPPRDSDVQELKDARALFLTNLKQWLA